MRDTTATTICVFLLTLASIVGIAHAENRARQGVDAFRNEQFAEAAEAFAEAEKQSPDDFRLTFNHGAALAADGKFDQALETLRRSAVAKDRTIASKSLALMGRISVDQIRKLLPEQPETLPEKDRQPVLDRLRTAQRYYGEALSLDPGHREFRQALEQLRAWQTRIEEQWSAADRIARRRTDFFERLQELENWQEQLAETIAADNSQTDSPKKFQSYFDTARQQRNLTEELAAMQNEFRQHLAQSQQDEESKSLEHLIEELQSMRNLSERAAGQLRELQGESALETAHGVGERLNRLRMNLAPFDVIAREAERRQAKLVEENQARFSELPPDQRETESPERTDQAKRQRQIADLMPLMVYRAKEEFDLSDKQANEAEVETADPRKRSMVLAEMNGPKIREHAHQAAQTILNDPPQIALGDQEQALKLLREILEPLQNQQQDPQQQDQRQGRDQGRDQEQNQEQSGQDSEKNHENRDQQNQNQRNQTGQDEPSRRQDRQNSEEQDEQAGQLGGKDDRKDDGQQQDDSGQDDKPPRDRKNEDKKEDLKDRPMRETKQDAKQDEKREGADETSPEKLRELERVERMLRQVRRKQQEANEKRERVRALLRQLEPVEKDW